ncbi:uncharacterized protein B0H18DRAFT_1032521 [Fomitopsis serialis]|uniref:uncharacterized protein n=1 Tax=Fomitopsis serialis TaxID=139415 RepID=UPI0020077518|nr:uncharacterized protein B0H18DRAFT_1032521 [Neoantrodia serialis]KAH9918084.1 hypothetical protein B0H18DRAFT_1032521 [Neoantrodia serialis]
MSSPPQGHPAESHNPTDSLVLHVDVLLLSVLGVFTLFALPRAVVRFMRLSEWHKGLLFYSTSTQRSATSSGAGSPEDGKSEKSNVSVRAMDANPSTLNTGEPSTGELPRHMSSWSSAFPGLSWLLSMQIRPGYSIGRLLLIYAYIGVVLYAGLFHSNPFTNAGRAGLVTVSQVPLVIALGTKNNIIGALVGQGYERLNYLHRAVGRIVILAINTHAIGLLYEFVSTGRWSVVVTVPHLTWGLVALICMDVLFLFSISTFREMFYHVFYVTHVVAAVLMMAAACMHHPKARPYVLAAVGIYGLDRILRIVKTRVATASLRAIPELGMVRVDIPHINSGWLAGQHLRLKVLSLGMGILGWTEPHPFTIASVCEGPNGDGLVLMCKKAGDWTGKLYSLAQRGKDGEAATGRSVTVLIDGPYGGPGNTVITSFSGVMLVAGGSGITYALSTVEELLQMRAVGSSRARMVELVWSVRNPSSLVPMVPLFSRLLEYARASGVSLQISVYYTRAQADDLMQSLQVLPPGLDLSPGRPPLERLLQGVVDRTSELCTESQQSPSGVLVGACGPAALTEHAGEAVRTFDRQKFKAVGGVELQEENFSW